MKITIEIVDGRWLVFQKGKPTRICNLWHQVIAILEHELTNKGKQS